MEQSMYTAITIAKKDIMLFPSETIAAPLIILNTFEHEGEKVWTLLNSMTNVDYSLAAISITHWNEEMSPWPIDPVTKWEDPFTGGADAYLKTMTDLILPELLTYLPGTPEYLALAGYSLAGLFALYSMYRTDKFSRIASASGSVWYPGYMEYVNSHDPLETPDRIYLSLGDKEAKTKNPVLRTVEDNTRKLSEHYRESGILTMYESNPGNHFRDSDERMAKGIRWILEGEK